MSNNFLKIFSTFIRSLTYKTSNITLSDFKLNFLTLSLLTSIHLSYTLTTENKEKIKVYDKYKLVNYGSTNFMIIDNNGRHFNVNNSLWYWKWDSIEDWSKINKDDTLYVRYYGWRMPIFGMFPNIIQYKNKEDK